MGDTEESIEDIEETAEEEEELEGAGRRKFLGPTLIRTLLYVAAALVLIIVSGTIAYIVAKRVGRAPATKKAPQEFREHSKPLAYYNELGEFSINTSDVDEPHFVKLNISLGYEEGKSDLQGEIIKRRPELRDIVISIVGSKKYSDLDTQDEREQLKEEIKRRINDVLINGKLEDVAITEFVLT